MVPAADAPDLGIAAVHPLPEDSTKRSKPKRRRVAKLPSAWARARSSAPRARRSASRCRAKRCPPRCARARGAVAQHGLPLAGDIGMSRSPAKKIARRRRWIVAVRLEGVRWEIRGQEAHAAADVVADRLRDAHVSCTHHGAHGHERALVEIGGEDDALDADRASPKKGDAPRFSASRTSSTARATSRKSKTVRTSRARRGRTGSRRVGRRALRVVDVKQAASAAGRRKSNTFMMAAFDGAFERRRTRVAPRRRRRSGARRRMTETAGRLGIVLDRSSGSSVPRIGPRRGRHPFAAAVQTWIDAGGPSTPERANSVVDPKRGPGVCQGPVLRGHRATRRPGSEVPWAAASSGRRRRRPRAPAGCATRSPSATRAP